MFEDKVAPQQNAPASVPSDPITPGTKPAPEFAPNAGEPAQTKEPDDIFATPGATPEAQKTATGLAPTPTPAPVQPQAEGAQVPQAPIEPAIKATPSVFTPKSGVVPDSQLTPNHSQRPKGGKNIVFLVVIILLVCVAVAAAIWWFMSRGDNTPSENPNLTNPYEYLDEETDDTQTPEADNLGDTVDDAEDLYIPPSDSPKDSDGDGLSDEDEMIYGTSTSSSDTDGDGLFDREEVEVYNTDPLKADTDGDSMDDKEELLSDRDPLEADSKPGYYKNTTHKFEVQLPEGMVLESESGNILRYNDNINQLKLYLVVDIEETDPVSPDIAYTISESDQGYILVNKTSKLPDNTPTSTVFGTNYLTSSNGHTYMFRYIATKRSTEHQADFEYILSSFKLLP